MRLVLDTDVMVAALRSPSGASRRLLRGGIDGRVTLVASVALIVEYEAVLKRPNHLAAAGIKANDVDTVLDQLAESCDQTETRVLWRPQLLDPDDEFVLEAAINGQADLLATFNVRHFADAAAGFGIAVRRPAEALRMTVP